MPTLLSERVLNLEFRDLYSRRPIDRPDRPLTRHRGWHQSGVLAYIAREVGWLKPGERLEEEMPWRMALGVMWEEFYFSLEPETTIWQPGEVVEDEIAVNADGLGLWYPDGQTNGQSISQNFVFRVVKETKCTEKKVREGVEFLNERLWMYQGMSYLHCYARLFDIPSSDLIVQWIINYYRGNYAGSGPIVKEHVVRFTSSEVEAAWRMYVKFRDRAEKED